MQSSMIGWVAFIVLGALISVTSCQAWYGSDASGGTTGVKQEDGQ